MLPPLLALLYNNPEAIDGDSLTWLFDFYIYARQLRDNILLTQPAGHKSQDPPTILPPSVTLFLSRVCRLSAALVAICWKVMKEVHQGPGLHCLVQLKWRRSFESMAIALASVSLIYASCVCGTNL